LHLGTQAEQGVVEARTQGALPDAEPLARDVQRRAVEDGAEVLALHTAESMVGARALYDRLGFQRVPDLDADLRNYLGSCGQGPVPALAYIRPLTPAGVDAASHVDEELAS
jgi:hypothetical protein